jgi:hypothetical protein
VSAPKKARHRHPWEAEAARTAPGTKTQNTHADPQPLLIILDKPALDTDVFILVHPGGKKKTVHRPDKVIAIDDTHVAIEVTGVPANRSPKDKYALVQKRGGKRLHVIFKEVNGPLLTMANEPAPQQREKQYYGLVYKAPDTKDRDLRAPLLDYRKVTAEDPKAP